MMAEPVLPPPVGFGGPPPVVVQEGMPPAAPVYAQPVPTVFVDDTVSQPDIDDYPQIDYRFYRYSKIATPWLILLLLFFVTLLGLTIWQGGLSIKRITPGIPRDMEPWAEADDGDGGLSRQVRNVRIAAAIFGIVPALLAGLFWHLALKPKLMRTVALVLALLLVVCAILSFIAFCLDVGKTEQAEECHTQIGVSGVAQAANRSCVNKEEYAVVVVFIEIILALVALATAVMLVLWKNHFRRERNPLNFSDRERELDGHEFTDDNQMRLAIPGQGTVYRSLIFLGLLVVLILAGLLLLFTILIHEFRERVTGSSWDPISKQSFSGWKKENTRLRLATTIIGILLVLLSLVPYPHRVYAYLIGFGFLVVAILCFVCFGLDVDDLKDARDLTCPSTGVKCIYHPYNATVVFDFLCGLLALLYVLIQFLACKKKSFVQAREYTAVDVVDDYDINAATFLGGPGQTLAERKLDPAEAPKTPGRLRPLLGVEVVEMEHPSTGDLSVSVINVTPGGAADEAGIRVGDIISRWNDMPIRCKADFAAAVRDAVIGATVTLQVIRQGPGGFGGALEFCRLAIRGVPT